MWLECTISTDAENEAVFTVKDCIFGGGVSKETTDRTGRYFKLNIEKRMTDIIALASSAFNMLAVMLFLLQDYFEYGVYTNTQGIIESNGSGDILWDKTINETFALLSNNRPYYPELLTMKRVNDDFDFFKRLHECILTRCTAELRDADLLDLFDIMGADISDERIEDFGDKEYSIGHTSCFQTKAVLPCIKKWH